MVHWVKMLAPSLTNKFSPRHHMVKRTEGHSFSSDCTCTMVQANAHSKWARKRIQWLKILAVQACMQSMQVRCDPTHAYNPCTERSINRRLTGVYWSSASMNNMSSTFSKKPCLNGTRKSMLEKHLLRLLGTLKHRHIHVHIPHTNTHKNNQ